MIVLYGAGPQNLRQAHDVLNIAGLEADYICDRDVSKWGKHEYGVEVIAPERLIIEGKKQKNLIIIITVRTQFIVDEIRQQLSILNNAKVYTTEEFCIEYQPYQNVKRLSHLIIHLADHCNLNCVRCCHMSPLVTETVFTDVNQYEKDLRKIAFLLGQKRDYLTDIQLGGGEPLLNPDCISYIKIAREYFPKSKLFLLTNGTLISNMKENFFEGCRRYDIELSITRYGIDIDMNQISDFLSSREVSFSFANQVDWESHVGKQMEKAVELVPEGGMNKNMNFLHCNANKNFILRNGRIYTCCTAAFVDYFNKYFGTNLPDPQLSGVNIYSITKYEELMAKLSEAPDLCEYCHPTDSVNGIEWSVSKREMSEWARC